MTDRPFADGTRDLRRWPSDPSQFVDTSRCPACFSPLAGARCPTCGLDLSVPASAELLALSTRVYDAELARQAFITRMRVEQAARGQAVGSPAPSRVASFPATDASAAAGPAPVATAPASGPAPVATAPAAMATQPPTVSAPPSGAPTAAAHEAPATSARSGVQVLLLTLGVVLISVTAIVFLFVAYLVASLEVRSVIIAGASVLVLGAAWLLRARRLPGTAEGVASVAIVLLLLDVWIVQANELFGSEALSPAAYTGIALVVVAALLAATRLASGIRVTGYGAAALLPVAAFLLASSPVVETEPATGAWLGALAGAVVGGVGSLVVRTRAPERVILLCAGFTGGALALVFAGWALRDLAWNELWSFLAVAVVWLVLVAVARRSRLAPAFGIVAATTAGLSGALAPAVGVVGEVDSGVAVWVAPALAGLVVCLTAAATHLPRVSRSEALSAFFAAVVAALAAAVPGAFAGMAGIGWHLLASVPPWDPTRLSGDGPAAEVEAGAVLVPVVVAAGSAGALALLGALRRFAAVPIGAAAAAVLVAGAVVDEPGLAVAIHAVLAGAALAVAATLAVRRVPGLLPTLAVLGMSAAGLSWWAGFSAAPVWPWAMLVSLVLVTGGRVVASRVWPAGGASAAGAAHVVVAVLDAAVILFTLPLWLDASAVVLLQPWDSPWMWLGTGAPLLLAATLFVPRLSTLDRMCAALPLIAASVVSSIAVATAGGAALAWLPGALAAAVGLVAVRASHVVVVRLCLAATTPVLLAFAVTSALADAGLDLEAIGPASATLFAAAAAHLVLPRTDTATRITWIVSVLVTALVALTVGWSIDGRWLALLILTPVPVLLAALGGDPIGGGSKSRHLAWASLPLAVGAVWAWLAGERVDDVEAYTLPLAGALATTAVLITWRRPAERPRAAGRTSLLAAAAGIAVLPSVASSADSELRTLVLVAAGTVVAIAGLFLPDTARGVPVRLIAVASGWVALTGAALVRGGAVALDGPESLPVEFWPALALGAGAVIAVGWANTASRPSRLAEAALAASVVAASVPTLLAIIDDDAPVLRSAILFPVLALLHVASVAIARRPVAGPALTWSSLGVLAVGGLAAIAIARVDPFDLVTVPLAAALLGAGIIRMRRAPALGSWPALGAGLAVLLVPPLIADVTDPELWRIVALGIVAALCVLIGALRRLQAPLLVGGGVLLVHALWQLWPWITDIYEAVWWWLWLGIAGVVLVVLAATYERQLRLARGVVRSIAGLR